MFSDQSRYETALSDKDAWTKHYQLALSTKIMIDSSLNGNQ